MDPTPQGSSIPEDILDLEVEENPSSSVVEDQSDDDLSPEQSLAEDYTLQGVRVRLPQSALCAMSRTARSLICDSHNEAIRRSRRIRHVRAAGARTRLAGGSPFDPFSRARSNKKSSTYSETGLVSHFACTATGATNHHQSGRREELLRLLEILSIATRAFVSVKTIVTLSGKGLNIEAVSVEASCRVARVKRLRQLWWGRCRVRWFGRWVPLDLTGHADARRG